jgi:hypothetical protein
VAHFLQLGPIFESFQHSSTQCHQLGTMPKTHESVRETSYSSFSTQLLRSDVQNYKMAATSGNKGELVSYCNKDKIILAVFHTFLPSKTMKV